MNRYKNIKQIDGRLKTIKFPTINISDMDTILVSRESDRLDLLANSFYDDESLYWIIALANNLGKGTLEIPSGTTIRIPYDTGKIIQEYNILNA